ncbi:hypothetical protein [Nonomuraea zeae]|uniref:Uncharacterized protein n=1 Tax=Nonomuraea zeae TaxID=1642303 RepID=A0A5S4GUP4_9ACTN|nr:hypothetical protein [Nonomuraea zeae]TMR30150.1 hypothetical protein ETD85_30145 [Nonomuraea zeae]
MTAPPDGSPGVSGPHGVSGRADVLDAADVAAIMRRQLRQALLTVAAVAVLLAGAPVIVLWLSAPWAWVALSLAVQCAWVGLAVSQLRRAERLER